MNPDALRAFNQAIDRAHGRHKDIFKIQIIDTTASSDAKASALLLLDELLKEMEQWASSSIVVIDKKKVLDLFAGRAYVDAAEASPMSWPALCGLPVDAAR